MMTAAQSAAREHFERIRSVLLAGPLTIPEITAKCGLQRRIVARRLQANSVGNFKPEFQWFQPDKEGRWKLTQRGREG